MTDSHRWNTFTAAPHRVMFFGGMVQLILAMVWWGMELGARYLALWPPMPPPVYATWAHAWLMLFGLFSCFMFS